LRAGTAKTIRAGKAAVVIVALALAGCGGSSGATRASSSAPSSSSGASRQAPTRTVPKLVVPANAPPRSVRVPVLTYHRVAALKPGASAITTDLTVDPANFKAELAALHAGGYHPISQAQLFDALYHGRALPPKPIVIS